jgi:hypothetical protein
MPDVFTEMMGELVEAFKKEAAIELVYHRGDSQTDIITGWLGQTVYQIEEQERVTNEWNDRDFLIPVESLVLDDASILPQEGDWIEIVGYESPNTYKLMATYNLPIWEYSDIQETLFRVRTKRFAGLS